MAVTWNVVALDATKTVGTLSDVVTSVHWHVSDSETVGSGDSAVVHFGYLNGVINLADPDASNFTAYDSITKDDAIAWAKAALGSNEVTAIETGIAAQITESKTPTKTSGVPW
mgnify:CR=1 FL=1|tara:strand:+ start:2890 stop:3228 length:339 start_codon:yes stop_codon:yes gene_type:complete